MKIRFIYLFSVFEYKHFTSCFHPFHHAHYPIPSPCISRARMENRTGSSKTSIRRRAAGRWKTEALRHCWLSALEVKGHEGSLRLSQCVHHPPGSNQQSKQSASVQHFPPHSPPVGVLWLSRGHIWEWVHCGLKKPVSTIYLSVPSLISGWKWQQISFWGLSQTQNISQRSTLTIPTNPRPSTKAKSNLNPKSMS